jgi:tRNA-binding EMAP/Myf-like protein
MPKKNRKKKGGDFDDYDDMLADPAPSSPVADGGGDDDEFAGMAKKKNKKKNKKKGGGDDYGDDGAGGDSGGGGDGGGEITVPTYAFGDAKKKSRSRVILRRRTRAAEFYEGLVDTGPTPEELAAAAEAAAAKAAQEARLVRLRGFAAEFGKTKRRATRYASLEEFRSALAADLAAEEENPGLELAEKSKKSKKSKKEDELVVAARVETVEPHPGSDKLFVVTLDAGVAAGCVSNVATLEEGDMVVFGHAGAVLPDGTVLAKVKVKGVESRGMICSPKNLGLGDEDKVPFDAGNYTPGTTLAEIVDAEVGEDAEEAAESEFGEKKKKKKKKKKTDGFDAEDGDDADADGSSEFGTKKKKKKKKKTEAFEDEVDDELLMLIGEKEAPSEDVALEGDIEGLEALTMGSGEMSEEEKKALKKKMLFMQKMVAEAEQEDTEKFGENKVVDEAPKKKLTAKQKRALKKKQEDEELERMLAGIDGDVPAPAEPAAADAPAENKSDEQPGDADAADPDKPMTAAQKKKAKKKRQEAEKKAKAAAKKAKGGSGATESESPPANDDAPEKLTMEFIMSKPKKVRAILLEKLAIQEEEEKQREQEAEAQAK